MPEAATAQGNDNNLVSLPTMTADGKDIVYIRRGEPSGGRYVEVVDPNTLQTIRTETMGDVEQYGDPNNYQYKNREYRWIEPRPEVQSSIAKREEHQDQVAAGAKSSSETWTDYIARVGSQAAQENYPRQTSTFLQQQIAKQQEKEVEAYVQANPEAKAKPTETVIRSVATDKEGNKVYGDWAFRNSMVALPGDSFFLGSFQNPQSENTKYVIGRIPERSATIVNQLPAKTNQQLYEELYMANSPFLYPTIAPTYPIKQKQAIASKIDYSTGKLTGEELFMPDWSQPVTTYQTLPIPQRNKATKLTPKEIIGQQIGMIQAPMRLDSAKFMGTASAVLAAPSYAEGLVSKGLTKLGLLDTEWIKERKAQINVELEQNKQAMQKAANLPSINYESLYGKYAPLNFDYKPKPSVAQDYFTTKQVERFKDVSAKQKVKPALLYVAGKAELGFLGAEEATRVTLRTKPLTTIGTGILFGLASKIPAALATTGSARFGSMAYTLSDFTTKGFFAVTGGYYGASKAYQLYNASRSSEPQYNVGKILGGTITELAMFSAGAKLGSYIATTPKIAKFEKMLQAKEFNLQKGDRTTTYHKTTDVKQWQLRSEMVSIKEYSKFVKQPLPSNIANKGNLYVKTEPMKHATSYMNIAYERQILSATKLKQAELLSWRGKTRGYSTKQIGQAFFETVYRANERTGRLEVYRVAKPNTFASLQGKRYKIAIRKFTPKTLPYVSTEEQALAKSKSDIDVAGYLPFSAEQTHTTTTSQILGTSKKQIGGYRVRTRQQTIATIGKTPRKIYSGKQVGYEVVAGKEGLSNKPIFAELGLEFQKSRFVYVDYIPKQKPVVRRATIIDDGVAKYRTFMPLTSVTTQKNKVLSDVTLWGYSPKQFSSIRAEEVAIAKAKPMGKLTKQQQRVLAKYRANMLKESQHGAYSTMTKAKQRAINVHRVSRPITTIKQIGEPVKTLTPNLAMAKQLPKAVLLSNTITPKLARGTSYPKTIAYSRTIMPSLTTIPKTAQQPIPRTILTPTNKLAITNLATISQQQISTTTQQKITTTQMPVVIHTPSIPNYDFDYRKITTPPPFVPIVGGGLYDFGLGGLGYVKVRRGYRYAPSLYAIGAEVIAKGKPKRGKVYTPFDVRPIYVGGHKMTKKVGYKHRKGR